MIEVRLDWVEVRKGWAGRGLKPCNVRATSHHNLLMYVLFVGKPSLTKLFQPVKPHISTNKIQIYIKKNNALLELNFSDKAFNFDLKRKFAQYCMNANLHLNAQL